MESNIENIPDSTNNVADNLMRPPVLYTLKYLVIGDSAVGKTCLIYRFTEDTFSAIFIGTVGKFNCFVAFITNGRYICNLYLCLQF